MNQLRGLGVFFEPDRPDFILSKKDDAIAFRRNSRLVSLGDLARSAARERNDPDVLLDAFGQTGRIRIIAMRFEVAAANEEDGAAVGSEGDLVDLLAVVIAIVGELPALVIRCFGGPEVARAFLIEHPGDRRRL